MKKPAKKSQSLEKARTEHEKLSADSSMNMIGAYFERDEPAVSDAEYDAP